MQIQIRSEFQSRSSGKERDTETGLDYFGARYYASNMGRFMSPDWSSKPSPVPYAELGDPQSLNLYGYVRNNPLSKADADGHCDSWGTCVQWVKDFVQAFKATNVNVTKSAYVVNSQSKDPSVALTKSDVKAMGGSVNATASGNNSSIKVTATPGASTSTTFGAGNVEGTVTNSFATGSAGASAGPDRTGAEAKAELLNWGGSISIGSVTLSGNVCVVCAGAGVSAGKTGFDVTAEAGVAGAGFSLNVGGKDVVSKSDTLGQTNVSDHVPYPVPDRQREQQ
jgi:RHS repeat-associated protein